MIEPRDQRDDPDSLRRDHELVHEVLAGDPRAGSRLARRLACVPRFLTALNRRRGGALGHHDLEDLSQDTLATIWEKLGTFHGKTTLERWVYRFSYLSMMNRLRKGARIAGVEGRRLESLPAEPGAEDRATGRRGALEVLLTGLPPAETEVVLLKHHEDCTFEEIAQRMSISPNTAKTRYYRALRRLEREVRGEDRS